MTEREPEKEAVPGCRCCAGGLSAAELKGIRFVAVAALAGMLGIAVAIAIRIF